VTRGGANLPPILAEIAEASSVDLALKIARRHGGTRVLMPTLPGGRNWLSAIAAPEQAAAIIEKIGAARRIDIPLEPGTGWYAASQRLSAELARLLDTGATNQELARALGTTERSIRRRKAKRRSTAAEGQGDLFG